jgi:DNA-binding transcriptional MocR family regulator
VSAFHLSEIGLTLDSASAEGIFLWAKLPPGIDPDRLVLDAQSQGILLAKGALFSPTAQSQNYFRFNAAYAADPLLIQFLSDRVRTAHNLGKPFQELPPIDP